MYISVSEGEKTSADKYLENKEEVARFYESARGMMDALNSLFRQGIERLDFGMNQWRNVDKKPSFEATTKPPPYSYDEKNYYINASNNMWYVYLWQGMRLPPAISELYYAALLNRIMEFMKNNDGFDFNKGIVYANLGVAQSAQKKLDEGFANIFKALIEDSSYSANEKTQYDLHRRDLYTQFEKVYIIEPLENIISQLGVPGISSIETFINSFLEELNDDQRSFFDYTFAKIMQSLEIWKEMENGFTANRLLAYTQDLCLFSEDFLKSKFSNPYPRWLLDDLVREAGFSVNLRGCGAASMADFDTKLSLELGSTSQPDKCFKILLTIRNYSSHNVGGGTSANRFYACYDEILSELIRAMCYFILLPKPISRPAP